MASSSVSTAAPALPRRALWPAFFGVAILAAIALSWMFGLAPVLARFQLAGQARHDTIALFRDPRSADFRRLKVWGAEVCGEVSATNGFGIYTGFRPFVWTSAAGAEMRPVFTIAATTPQMKTTQAQALEDWDSAWRACQANGQ